MVGQLAPDHDYMESFRQEISHLTVQHVPLTRIKEKTTTLARESERLTSGAPLAAAEISSGSQVPSLSRPS